MPLYYYANRKDPVRRITFMRLAAAGRVPLTTRASHGGPRKFLLPQTARPGRAARPPELTVPLQLGDGTHMGSESCRSRSTGVCCRLGLPPMAGRGHSVHGVTALHGPANTAPSTGRRHRRREYHRMASIVVVDPPPAPGEPVSTPLLVTAVRAHTLAAPAQGAIQWHDTMTQTERHGKAGPGAKHRQEPLMRPLKTDAIHV